jgi:hypothetical protein
VINTVHIQKAENGNAMRTLQFKDRSTLEDFIKNEREQMYEMILESIEYAFVMNEEIAEVCTMHVVKENVYIDMISRREEWKESLSLALEYYVTEEKYEMCSVVKNLIDDL